MNTRTNASNPIRWRWARWLIPLVSLPIVGFLFVASRHAMREAAATAEIDALIAPIRDAGQPLGDAWLEQHFREQASSEGTAAWSEILMLVSTASGWADVSDLPIVGSGASQPLLDPDADWPANERVGAYLDEMRPVIDLIHEAAECPKPVWQPMVFNGFLTLLPELQESRGIVRLLQLDAEHALYNREPERAMAAIRSMKATADAFDWHMFMVGEFVHVAQLGMLYATIGRSLQCDQWNEADIDQLMALIEDQPSSTDAWRAVFQAEKAWVLASLESKQSLGLEVELFATRNATLKLLRMYEGLEDLADGSPYELRQRIEVFEGKLDDNASDGSSVLIEQFLPYPVQYAEALLRSQDVRQLVWISLAVKKYQLMHETLPSQLSDLSGLGIQIEDWTVPGAGALGYAVEDDTAYLWSAYGRGENQYQRTTAVPIERPIFKLDELHNYFYLSIVK